MSAWKAFLGRNTDVAMVLVVLGVLTVLFVPVPRGLLDFLILANFAFALLILLLTFYMTRPVDFLPFLLIDLVVSSVLMALGMMMLPPATVALPLKVLMFVLVDGWALILKALVGSFH